MLYRGDAGHVGTTLDPGWSSGVRPGDRTVLAVSTGLAILLTTHLGATAAMVGLIWFVQIVHYPLFREVGTDHFVEYEARHVALTGFVVGPPMAIEGLTALAIAAVAREEVGLPLIAVGLGLLAVIHASTVFLQVPAHASLSDDYDDAVARRLVSTNWIRTVGWTLRGGVAAAMIVVAA